MTEIWGVSKHSAHKEKCGMIEVLYKAWEDPCLSVPSAMEAFLVTFSAKMVEEMLLCSLDEMQNNNHNIIWLLGFIYTMVKELS